MKIMNINKIAQGSGNKYTAVVTPNVHVSFSKPGVNYTVDADKVTIPFNIDIEAREWGIKSILIYASPVIVPVHLKISEWKDEGPDIETEKDIQVDISKLGELKQEGTGGYTVGGMFLELNEVNGQFEVNYEESYIDINVQ